MINGLRKIVFFELIVEIKANTMRRATKQSSLEMYHNFPVKYKPTTSSLYYSDGHIEFFFL